ncbi:hypothetical protein DIPPA_31062 [Diplonema papillatum]|nr:hypothetical protein DIPPA_31062 [Diplonema papillatum]
MQYAACYFLVPPPLASARPHPTSSSDKPDDGKTVRAVDVLFRITARYSSRLSTQANAEISSLYDALFPVPSGFESEAEARRQRIDRLQTALNQPRATPEPRYPGYPPRSPEAATPPPPARPAGSHTQLQQQQQQQQQQQPRQREGSQPAGGGPKALGPNSGPHQQQRERSQPGGGPTALGPKSGVHQQQQQQRDASQPGDRKAQGPESNPREAAAAGARRKPAVVKNLSSSAGAPAARVQLVAPIRRKRDEGGVPPAGDARPREQPGGEPTKDAPAAAAKQATPRKGGRQAKERAAPKAPPSPSDAAEAQQEDCVSAGRQQLIDRTVGALEKYRKPSAPASPALPQQQELNHLQEYQHQQEFNQLQPQQQKQHQQEFNQLQPQQQKQHQQEFDHQQEHQQQQQQQEFNQLQPQQQKQHQQEFNHLQEYQEHQHSEAEETPEPLDFEPSVSGVSSARPGDHPADADFFAAAADRRSTTAASDDASTPAAAAAAAPATPGEPTPSALAHSRAPPPSPAALSAESEARDPDDSLLPSVPRRDRGGAVRGRLERVIGRGVEFEAAKKFTSDEQDADWSAWLRRKRCLLAGDADDATRASVCESLELRHQLLRRQVVRMAEACAGPDQHSIVKAVNWANGKMRELEELAAEADAPAPHTRPDSSSTASASSDRAGKRRDRNRPQSGLSCAASNRTTPGSRQPFAALYQSILEALRTNSRLPRPQRSLPSLGSLTEAFVSRPRLALSLYKTARDQTPDLWWTHVSIPESSEAFWLLLYDLSPAPHAGLPTTADQAHLGMGCALAEKMEALRLECLGVAGRRAASEEPQERAMTHPLPNRQRAAALRRPVGIGFGASKAAAGKRPPARVLVPADGSSLPPCESRGVSPMAGASTLGAGSPVAFFRAGPTPPASHRSTLSDGPLRLPSVA